MSADLIEQIKAAIGVHEFAAFESRWREAIAEDPVGLQKAIRDLRAQRTGIRNPAGWLWKAFRAERDGHHRLQETRR